MSNRQRRLNLQPHLHRDRPSDRIEVVHYVVLSPSPFSSAPPCPDRKIILPLRHSIADKALPGRATVPPQAVFASNVPAVIFISTPENIDSLIAQSQRLFDAQVGSLYSDADQTLGGVSVPGPDGTRVNVPFIKLTVTEDDEFETQIRDAA